MEDEFRDCTRNCNLKEHGDEINSIIGMNCNEDTIIFNISRICNNVGRVRDTNGRTALHVATSYGKLKIIKWLIEKTNADINARDYESGYTPLHKSIYRGLIKITIFLLKYGADLNLTDKEFMSPIDLLMKFPVPFPGDKRIHLDVSLYGTNNNYNLGIGDQKERLVPERNDFLYKINEDIERVGDPKYLEKDTSSYSVGQVYMSDFHSLLINNVKNAFVCGYGRGGRLGTGSEQTALSPIPLDPNLKICYASIARYHTVLISANKEILSCGLNNYSQLGHNPAPDLLTKPKVIKSQHLKNIQNITTGRCHTIFWNKDSDSFIVCGLNGGQFGLSSQFEKIISPYRVDLSTINISSSIEEIKSSDGCVLIRNVKDELYLLNNFECLKIKTKKGPPSYFQRIEIDLFAIHGGTLNSSLLKNEMMDKLIRILVLFKDKKLYLWDSNSRAFTRCFFSNWTPSLISHIHLNNKGVLFIADENTYSGIFKISNKNNNKISKTTDSIFDKDKRFIDKSECVEIIKQRLSFFYRPELIVSDPKGDNIAVLQKKAYNNIWSKSDIIIDNIYIEHMLNMYTNAQSGGYHDIIIQVNEKQYFLHKYLLVSKSKFFAKILENSNDHLINITKELSTNQIKIVELLFIYIYTKIICVNIFKDIYLKHYHSQSYPITNKFLEKQYFTNETDDYKELAEFFKIDFDFTSVNIHNEFVREEFQNLWDIKLKSSDGLILNAHICILAGRNEYFNTLLSWREYSTKEDIQTLFSFSELKLFLEFVYAEKFSEETIKKTNTDLFCDLLVVSDFLTDNYLKCVCENILCRSVTIYNIKKLYQLSNIYKVEKLKQTVLEFILNNLLECLEKRILEDIEPDFLEEVNDYFLTNCYFIKNKTPLYKPYTYDSDDEDGYKKRRAQSNPIKNLLINDDGYIKPKHRRKRYNSSTSKSQENDFIENKEELSKDYLNNASKSLSSSFTSSGNEFQINLSNDDFPDLCLSNEYTKSKTNFVKCKPKIVCGKNSKYTSLKSQKAHPLFELNKGLITLSINKLYCDIPPTVQSSQIAIPPPNPWMRLNPAGVKDKEPENNINFSDIVQNEQRHKTNYIKMKTKSLHLTQLEDKAMDELLIFYNAADSDDENITVFRYTDEPMSLPEWINQKRKTM